MKRPRGFRERPAERATASAGLVLSLLVGIGLDRPTAAWIALGVSLLPSVISPLIDWWRSRP